MFRNIKFSYRLYYVVVFLQGMVFYAPIATLYRQAKGLTVFDITLIESLSLLLMIAMEIPWGMLADRLGYKRTIVVCNVLFFVSKIIFWKAQGFGAFLAERLVLAVVLAGLSGCDSAYLFTCAQGKDSQKIFGLYEAMGAAGIIFASVVFSLFLANDYQLCALLTVVSYGVAMLLSLLLPVAKVERDRDAPYAARLKAVAASIGKNKKFLLFLIAASFLAQSSQTITVFLNQLQYLRSGIPLKVMGYLYILVTGASFVSMLSHKVTARIGEGKMLGALFAAAGIACVAMAFFASPFISIAGIVLLRASASFAVPISMDVQNRQVSVADRATILSVYSMAMDGVAVGTNLVFGKAADAGVNLAMGIGGLFCLCGLALYLLWRRLERPTALQISHAEMDKLL